MFKILVETSARHVHLTQEQVDVLFPGGLTIKKELSIKGQFAYNEKVYVKGSRTDGRRTNELAVTVLGPARDVPQLELSKSDIIHLGIDVDAPERLSGDIDGAPQVEICTSAGAVTVPLIVSMRHIHMPMHDHLILGSTVINIWLSGSRGEYIINEVPVRRTPGCERPTLHIDTDEANAFGTIYESRIVPLTQAQISKQTIHEVWSKVGKHVDATMSLWRWK